MTNDTEQHYFERRVAEERALAENATDPVVAAVHAELADLYAARLAETSGTAIREEQDSRL